MTRRQNPHQKSASVDASCVRCGCHEEALRRCCLTGMGDHPRYFYLCPKCWNATIERASARVSPQPPAMTEEEMRRETRRQKALDRLGSDNPVCACCPETDPFCMELHHLEGKDFGETLVILCRNCHRKLSEPQKDHPSKFGSPPTTLETIGQFLLGLADLFLLLAGKLKEFGAYLIDQARDQCARPTAS